jgi:transcriptional regulator with XRE-family HTH domain
MARRRWPPATILTDDEVKAIVAAAEVAAGPEIVAIAKRLGVDRDAKVRLLALQLKCGNAREKLGLSLTQAAARLRVPQYRLRAIENGVLRTLDADVLRLYVQLLGVGRWFRRWVVANANLAARIGIDEESGLLRHRQVQGMGAQSNKRLHPTALGAIVKRRG